MWPFRAKPAQELVDTFVRSTSSRAGEHGIAHRAILDVDPKLRGDVIICLANAIADAEFPTQLAIQDLLQRLLRDTPDLDESQLEALLGVAPADLPVAAMVKAIEQFVGTHGLP